MDGKQSLSKATIELRKRLTIAMIPLSLFVAGYCLVAAQASGGSRPTREGEFSYSAPVHHSREFYTGLRWSVMTVGGLIAIIAYIWNRRSVTWVFGSVAVLFNPFVVLPLSKEVWELIDMLAFWVFLPGAACLWPSEEACKDAIEGDPKKSTDSETA
jgi:hypothetical protein